MKPLQQKIKKSIIFAKKTVFTAHYTLQKKETT